MRKTLVATQLKERKYFRTAEERKTFCDQKTRDSAYGPTKLPVTEKEREILRANTIFNFFI